MSTQPIDDGNRTFTCEEVHSKLSQQLNQCTSKQLASTCKALAAWERESKAGLIKATGILWVLRPKNCEIIVDSRSNNEIRLLDEDGALHDVDWAKLQPFVDASGLRLCYATGLGGSVKISRDDEDPTSTLIEYCKSIITKRMKQTIRNNL